MILISLHIILIPYKKIQEKRIKKQEISKLNNAPHTMTRGGYDFVEVREMERKMKEHKEEASKSGEDVIIDPPSPPSHHQRWKLGRQKRSGGVSSDVAREIITEIASLKYHLMDELEEQCTHGRFTPNGRHDILVESIGRPEHPGCVRGIRFGVGIRDYFRRSSRRSTSSITESIVKGSCVDVVSSTSVGKTPHGDTGRFGFYMEEHILHLIAIGQAPHGDSILHGAHLPAHLVKIVVEEAVDGSAEVPIPTEENEHWKILVIIPAKGVVLWFCSLHHKPDPRIKDIVQNVISKLEVGSVGITSCTDVDHCPGSMDGDVDNIEVLPIDRIYEIRAEWVK
ncbi:hypothetical protein OROMI_014717 [Orobanche minor]